MYAKEKSAGDRFFHRHQIGLSSRKNTLRQIFCLPYILPTENARKYVQDSIEILIFV